MPSFNIIKESKIKETFRTEAVKGTFDLNADIIKEQFVGDIEIDNNWQIGLIVGNSGTGKTTIAKQLFYDAYVERFDYDNELSIIDNMPKTISMTNIYKAFNSVGLSSVPCWLKPYSVLSNGEKMRCDLARALLSENDMFVFDEFTSVVDRNIAQIGSFAIQKAIRKSNKKFIAVSCHYDIEDWLLPDWVFDTNNMTFRKCEEQKKNRPAIRFDIYEVREKEYYWKMFAKYHYLNHNINKTARCFIGLINNQISCFTSVLPFPHPTLRNTWREHRTVVLPDFQGIGLSRILTNFIGETLLKEGKSLISTSSNPAIIQSRKTDSKWIITRKGRTSKGGKNSIFSKKSLSVNRITISFKYIG